MVLSVNFGENPTDKIINNISTGPTGSTTSNIGARTQDQFFSDIKKTMSDGVYETQDEAVKGVLEYAKNKGVSYTGINSENLLSEISVKETAQIDQDQGISGFASETKEALGERVDNTSEIFARFNEKNIKGSEEIQRAFKEEGLGGAFEASMKKQLGILGSAWQLVGQGAGATSDVIWEGIENITQEVLPEEAEQAIQNTIEGIGDTETVQSLVESYTGFRERNPETARNLEASFNIGGALLDLAGGKIVTATGKESLETGLKTGKELLETGLEKTKTGIDDLTSKFKKTETDGSLEKLGLTTEKGKIGDIEVNIPIQKKGIVEKIATPFTEKDVKTLAGRAVSPRTLGQSAKQKLSSIKNVENHTKEFYENIRTGKLVGNIDTLENASQSMVNNIDTVGARIGDAVKKVDGIIDIDNELIRKITTALSSKGSEISPATPILKKFSNSLGDGKLSIADAYELKKAYSNEVTKLYKANDAGTSQYKALSDGVKLLNEKIDDIINTKLGSEFADDKKLFRNLKTLVDDMVSSSLVEGRRSPNTFAEQIGMIESIFSPVSSVKQKLIKTVGEANTRGGAWEALIKNYDKDAVSAFKGVTKTDNIINTGISKINNIVDDIKE